ncbi:MAG: DUF1287 domain-containing protein [Chitinophagales bacterium]|nr:DUF1287 domain-containing protein [Chitinophagales bacterium]MDW8418763.1 DUF1287 domain-containing protein [Chitinophagales bacterium]
MYLLLIIPFLLQTVQTSSFGKKLSDAAIALTHQHVTYDAAYRVIPYPGGDVPSDRGVCSDVVIRAYRRLGVDLQRLVHEDMKRNFNVYPRLWGLSQPDPNIDHRRVPNLMTYFARHSTVKPISKDASDYVPGDIVCWRLTGNLTHIGIVVEPKSPDGRRHLIVHNIGAGQVMEDVLFAYTIIGHYRYERTGGVP